MPMYFPNRSDGQGFHAALRAVFVKD